MRIIIKTKNLELTDALNAYVQKHFQAIGKLVKDNADIFVEIEKETLHHRKGQVFCAEAEVILPGKKIMAKAKADDLLKAIVQVKKELEREIKNHKTKTIELPRRQFRKIKKEIT